MKKFHYWQYKKQNEGRVEHKLEKSRYDYVILQLYLHQLVQENLGKNLKFTYGSGIKLHEFGADESRLGYQSSTVLDEPEREAGTTSIPIPQREESENIPLPDLSGQLENVQQSGNEIAKRGMPT